MKAATPPAEKKVSGYYGSFSALPPLPAIRDRFYISAKKEVLSCEGGTCTLYERAGDFATYEVVPKETKLTLRT